MSATTRQVLSANLRYLRLMRGWSQEQLAEQCGLHRTYIGAIERCERNLGVDNLDRLARALDTSVPELLKTSAWLPVRESRARYNAGEKMTLTMFADIQGGTCH